jgi:uncharacterized membrane protein
MTDLVVLAFDAEDTAEQVRNKLVDLNKQYLLNLREAVEVVRHSDGKVKIKDEPRLTGIGALGGAFWGFLIGLIFLMPEVGFAVGAVGGAIVGHFTNYGIDRSYMKQVEESIQPGQSAIFIVANDLHLDRIEPELKAYHPRVLRTSLSADQEEKLREAFGTASVAPMPAKAA